MPWSDATPNWPSGWCASTRWTSRPPWKKSAISWIYMDERAGIDTSGLSGGRGARARPKGRPVDPQALAEIQDLLGDAPRRRDLLIEFLHRIQDRYGCISAPHIVALASEMRLAMTEVYE